jgi:hypothetical protein
MTTNVDLMNMLTRNLSDAEFESAVFHLREIRQAAAAAVAEQRRTHEWSRGVSTSWQTRQIEELRLQYARCGFAGPWVERRIMERVYG